MKYKINSRRGNAKAILGIIATIAIIIMALDIIGFMGWALSGQQPADGFYVGTITTHILRAVL